MTTETGLAPATPPIPAAGIPVRYLSNGEMLAEVEAELRQYEVRYEMPSEKMATLLELDAINPTAEVLKWYATYQGAKLLRARTTQLAVVGQLPNRPRIATEPAPLRSGKYRRLHRRRLRYFIAGRCRPLPKRREPGSNALV